MTTHLFILIVVMGLLWGCQDRGDMKTETKGIPSSALNEKKDSPGRTIDKDRITRARTEGEYPSGQTENNTPPRITAMDIVSQSPVIGSTIKAEVKTFDREDDAVSLTYEWSRNGEPLFESSDTLTISKEEFNKGDKITLRATPFDGRQKGAPVSMVVTIANAPPVIKPLQGKFRFDGKICTDEVVAIDPDGDPLTFTLRDAPEGMSINPGSGQITWNVPEDFKGSVSFIACVSDGQGGEALQTFTIEIGEK